MYGNDTSNYIALRLENQRVAEEMATKGIDLSKMSGELDALKKEVERLKSESASLPKASPEILAIKEKIVEANPAVQTAKSILAKAEANAMYNVLMKDAGYSSAMKAYWEVVDREYISSFQSGSGTGAVPAVAKVEAPKPETTA